MYVRSDMGIKTSTPGKSVFVYIVSEWRSFSEWWLPDQRKLFIYAMKSDVRKYVNEKMSVQKLKQCHI